MYGIFIYIYLLTFTITNQPNAGKYTSQMDGMGMYLKPYPGTHIFQTSSSGIDSTVASHKLRHSCTKLSKESSGSGAACSQANTKTWPSPGNRNFPWQLDHGRKITVFGGSIWRMERVQDRKSHISEKWKLPKIDHARNYIYIYIYFTVPYLDLPTKKTSEWLFNFGKVIEAKKLATISLVCRYS